MKKIITALFSLAAISFAADVQVLPPTGADFATDAPDMVQSLVRAAVSQSGNTPVESGADIQLRTNVMTMGSSIVVVCEQVNGGSVVASGKQKAGSVDELDVAIEGAVGQALANVDQAGAPESDAYAPAPSYSDEPQYVYVVPVERSSNEDPNDNFAHKRPTRNYVSYGLGMALWSNYDFTDKSCDQYSNSEDCHDARAPYRRPLVPEHGCRDSVPRLGHWPWHPGRRSLLRQQRSVRHRPCRRCGTRCHLLPQFRYPA